VSLASHLYLTAPGSIYRYFVGDVDIPFGHGLSYTTFRYSRPRLVRDEIGTCETAAIVVHVTNTGRRDGDEVVQVAVHKGSNATHPT
jgi:beta-glucosidase